MKIALALALVMTGVTRDTTDSENPKCKTLNRTRNESQKMSLLSQASPMSVKLLRESKIG
jgi:hypothetical protein